MTSAASSRIAEKLPAVGQTDVHVAAGPAERNDLDVLLAVLRPHHAGYDRHRPVERVLGPRAAVSLRMACPGDQAVMRC